MYSYSYIKEVNSSRLEKEIIAAGLSDIVQINTVGTSVSVSFNSNLSLGQKNILDTVVASHILATTREMIDKIIDEAMAFGNLITRDFVAENVMLGITQRRLTGHVRKTLNQVKDAIESGSLYDAITEIKSLDINAFDSVIITPVRMLVFRNKIETYLKIPLATSWDAPETWL